MRRILGAFAAAAVLSAVADAAADDGRRVVGPAAPTPYDGRWTSHGYPRSWSPAGPPTAVERRAAAAAVPPSVVVAPTPGDWTMRWIQHPSAYRVDGPATVASSGPVRVVPPAPPCAPFEPVVVAPPCPPRPCPPRVLDLPRERRTCLTVETWARYWRPEISGSTFITIGGEPGTASRIEADDDLDLEAEDGTWALGGAVSLGRHRAFLEYEELAFDGEATLAEGVVFHGVTYPAGTEVESSLDLTIWKGGYDYALVDERALDVRGGASAWVWTFDQRLRSSAEDERREFTHVLPVAHLEADARLGVAHLAARAAFGWVGNERWVADLSAAVGVRFFDHVALDVGWRWMRFSFDETTNEGELTYSGPFAALSVDF